MRGGTRAAIALGSAAAVVAAAVTIWMPEREEEAARPEAPTPPLDPASRCVAEAREHYFAGNLAAAEKTAQDCQVAGLDHPSLDRIVADVADTRGEYLRARMLYVEAEALVHAAAITCQESLPDEDGLVERALADTADPAVALHRVWCGRIEDRPEWVQGGARAIVASGQTGPEFSLALATAALEADRPVEALGFLESSVDPRADWLRGRSFRALGRADEADAAFARAEPARAAAFRDPALRHTTRDAPWTAIARP